MSQIDRRAFMAIAAATVTTTACTTAGRRAGAEAQAPLPSAALTPPVMPPPAMPPAVPSHAGWSARSPMPWPVQEIYAGTWGDFIAVAGGLVASQGEGGMTLHVEDRMGLYDPATDAWTEGPSLPAARHHPMLIGTGESLWAIGGYRQQAGVGDWINSREVWQLSATGWSWSEVPALPVPQAEAVGLAHGGHVHLISGRSPGGEANAAWTDQVDVATHLVLDGDRWHEARPCPMARNSAAGAVLDGAMWVAGGRTVSGGGTGQLDRYDPADDRWDTLAPIPVSPATGVQVGGGLAMAAMQGKLVAFGGEWFRPRAEGGGGGVFAETWIYDPATDAWTQGPEMRTPRHGLAAASSGGRIYALGGGDVVSGGHATALVEVFNF